MKKYSISIAGIMPDPKSFIKKWSEVYYDRLEYKYNQNIEKGLDTNESFKELMLWKNGTDENFSKNKTKAIEEFMTKRAFLNSLKTDLRLSNEELINAFEKEIHPDKSSTIWKIFLLHIINPANNPIFDQHVYRSFSFFSTGEIKELPIDKYPDIYQIYKNYYSPWFMNMKRDYDLEPRTIDKALFSFGRTLKALKNMPIIVLNE